MVILLVKFHHTLSILSPKILQQQKIKELRHLRGNGVEVHKQPCQLYTSISNIPPVRARDINHKNRPTSQVSVPYNAIQYTITTNCVWTRPDTKPWFHFIDFKPYSQVIGFYNRKPGMSQKHWQIEHIFQIECNSQYMYNQRKYDLINAVIRVCFFMILCALVSING